MITSRDLSMLTDAQSNPLEDDHEYGRPRSQCVYRGTP
jgi:hypothetical protein